jgi:uncharacterized protein
MARNYINTIFTDAARSRQELDGSRASYARMEEGGIGAPDQLSEKEGSFVSSRDSFYLASVTSEGWPYVQHRGGPAGFLKLLPGNRLGFADYRGNRQFVSLTNVESDSRVSLFIMDYPNRRRLKILGHASFVEAADDPALVASLMPDGYKAVPERACIIDVVGFDWNCPQHITPRFTEAEIEAAMRPMADELDRLRSEIDVLHAKLSHTSKGEQL